MSEEPKGNMQGLFGPKNEESARGGIMISCVYGETKFAPVGCLIQ
jgi:hypothetical protein